MKEPWGNSIKTGGITCPPMPLLIEEDDEKPYLLPSGSAIGYIANSYVDEHGAVMATLHYNDGTTHLVTIRDALPQVPELPA